MGTQAGNPCPHRDRLFHYQHAPAAPAQGRVISPHSESEFTHSPQGLITAAQHSGSHPQSTAARAPRARDDLAERYGRRSRCGHGAWPIHRDGPHVDPPYLRGLPAVRITPDGHAEQIDLRPDLFGVWSRLTGAVRASRRAAPRSSAISCVLTDRAGRRAKRAWSLPSARMRQGVDLDWPGGERFPGKAERLTFTA
jgi:hypothetical protein